MSQIFLMKVSLGQTTRVRVPGRLCHQTHFETLSKNFVSFYVTKVKRFFNILKTRFVSQSFSRVFCKHEGAEHSGFRIFLSPKMNLKRILKNLKFKNDDCWKLLLLFWSCAQECVCLGQSE